MSSNQSTNFIVSNLSTSLKKLESLLELVQLNSNQKLIIEKEESLLEKAKLQVMLVYTVHELILIYLKLTGVDPSTHPVLSELERLTSYFDKLGIMNMSSNVLESAQPQPKFKIDQAAAARFITAAIGSNPKHIHFATSTTETIRGAGLENVSRKKRMKFDPFEGYDTAKN